MHRFAMYSPLRKWKKGGAPLEPFLYLSVGMHTTHEGNILLSSELKSSKEIDEIVDQLIQELEGFRKKAKKELELIHNQMLTK